MAHHRTNPHVSKRTKHEIHLCIRRGDDLEQIEQQLDVLTHHLRRFKKNLQLYGSMERPQVGHQGQPHALSGEMEEVGHCHNRWGVTDKLIGASQVPGLEASDLP